MAAPKREAKQGTEQTTAGAAGQEASGESQQPAATKARSGSRTNAAPRAKAPADAQGAPEAQSQPRAKPGGRTGGKGARAQQPDLRTDLREFASARPGGWSHHEWEGLLGDLRTRGHDTQDSESIGRALERERLALSLERVEGLGPRRVQALTDHFGTLWSLRHASTDEIAAVPSIPRNLAERVAEAMK